MAEQEKKEEEDKDMSMEEREQWLRDRGVQIENPGNRSKSKQKQDGLSINEQLALTTLEVKDGIQFVYIPHDETEPVRTLRLPVAMSTKGGDCLPNYVKSHFADLKSIDSTLLQQQTTKHFAAGALEGLGASGKVSAAAMNAVAAEGTVETFPLVHPDASNQWQGVYIYLDEVGLLKKLPPNGRATQLAVACGYHPPPQFYGNVFVGRVAARPKLHNLDFEAGPDTDPTAPWLLRAPAENAAWQQEMNRVTNRPGATQPIHVGTEGTDVVEDQYSWNQQDEEIEINVPLAKEDDDDPPLDKKLVKVKFNNTSIVVTYAGETKLSLELYAGIDVDACTWTLEGGKKLVISCEKANPGELWPRMTG